jgi:hypothetical protein
MSATIDFAGHAKNNMSALSLVPVDLDPKLARIQVEGGAIALDLFKEEKRDKVFFCFYD